jgi:hypothetical protein
VVIKLHFFVQPVALYVPQQAVKIVFNLVIADHVFYSLVVIDVVVFLGLSRRGFCYDPATRIIRSLLVDKLYRGCDHVTLLELAAIGQILFCK